MPKTKKGIFKMPDDDDCLKLKRFMPRTQTNIAVGFC